MAEQDYDMKGYLADGGKPKPEGEHYPDTYKNPSHITFSNESIHSKPGQEGGQWKYLDTKEQPMEEKTPGGKWHFYPSEHNLKNHPAEEMKKYFQEHEPDSVVHIPDSKPQDEYTKTLHDGVDYQDVMDQGLRKFDGK